LRGGARGRREHQRNSSEPGEEERAFLLTSRSLEKVLGSLPENGPMDEARRLGMAAIHSSETSWQANLIFLLLALYFMIRGSVAFGLDNLLG